MILVTGANGTVGSEVVRQLQALGTPVRALVRDPAKAHFGPGVEVVQGDLTKPETLAAAVAGVDKVFLLAGGAELVALEGNLLNAAKAAGVTHIVKLSVVGAQYEPTASYGRFHQPAEKALQASGLAWTLLRPCGFMSNAFGWVGSIKSQGAFYFAAGDGKMALIDPHDIAAVAVAALTTPGHEGKAYDITGPGAFTMAEQAQILAEAVGRDIKFVDIPADALRNTMLGYGMSAPEAEALVEMGNAIRAGYAGALTTVVQEVTGKAPRRFEDWAKQNAGAFR